MLGFPSFNKLRPVPKQPTYPLNIKVPVMQRRLHKIRGAELVHNQLIHKQYGIIALSGGQLKIGHYDMIRNVINRKLDFKRNFAIWRVDPPNRSVTKHGQGRKLGGGKGDIDHFMYPVKRGRVIIEVGGDMPFEMVFRTLEEVAEKLPFPAKVVTQQMMDDMEKLDEEIRVNNANKLRWEWCVKNNILNCINYLGRHDIEYSHFGPDVR